MLGFRFFDCKTLLGKKTPPFPDLPSVLLVTLPKSGSIFIRGALASSLRLKIVDPSPGYFPIDHLSVKTMKLLARGGCVAQTHIDPSPLNLNILDHYKPIWLLHLRDPRSALLSWVHHVDRLRREQSESLLYTPPQLPARYGSMSFEEKLDWQIVHFFPQMIRWIERWVEVVDRRNHDLVTTFDQMHNRNQSFIRELIGRLYGDDLQVDIRLPAKTMQGSHFRSGRRDEWRECFSQEQIDRTTRMISSTLCQRFNWADMSPPVAETPRRMGSFG